MILYRDKETVALLVYSVGGQLLCLDPFLFSHSEPLGQGTTLSLYPFAVEAFVVILFY